ncbi:hypothetical protein FXO38_28445 [Capsicum annuum]|nr:hypothetical protein FXO38_28445 [Capsicum annuum]
MCTWLEKHNRAISIIFERNASAKLRNWLERVRHTRNVAQWLLKETKELDRGPTQLEIFRRTHLLKKTNELDPEVWVKPRAENANAEAVDGVQLAAMSQQITDLSRAFAQFVAQNKVMSKTVKDLKKQVVSMSRRRHRSPFLDSSSKEETESDEFVDTTP